MYKHDDPEDAHSHGYIYNNTKIAFFFKAGLAKQSFYALETRIYTTKVL